MRKMAILTKLSQAGVIAVVRGSNKEEALKASDAIVDGGMYGLEITFTVPQADQIIAELAEKYRDHEKVVVGAGTVLDSYTARLAIMAGAEFVVSPCFDIETAKICNLYQIPYLPGCMTITEMKEALIYGVDIIKLFPGSTYGPSIVKAFKAPLSFLNIMPTGGVNLDNMKQWFKAGVVAVGVGGNLLAPVSEGNFAEVTSRAKQYMDKYHEIKGE